VHFHVPIFFDRAGPFHTTQSYLAQVIGLAGTEDVTSCLEEMETYTWEVMPEEMKKRDVVDQLTSEYDWTLKELAKFGFSRD